jgi:N-acetylglutamate synthase-like GNAT family acetyltransferase
MTWEPRAALKSDIPQLRDLIPRSSFELQRDTYTREQIEAALGPVFGVDEQLIEDQTFYVVEESKKIVACGGWSFRKSLFGGDGGRKEKDSKLDPRKDSARIRAFFIDPDYARQGIGSAIMRRCEVALIEMGFSQVEISATLVGESLYAKFGYTTVERYEIPLNGTKPITVVKMTRAYR